MLLVDPADSQGPPAQALLAELSRELADRYPDDATLGLGDFTTEDAAAPRSIFLVAWFGSDAVGCGALRPFAAEPATTAEIKHMYVAPAARGKGIGRELLYELERHAQGMGYTRLVLETGIRQPEAVALYEQAGYRSIPSYAPYDGNPHSRCFAKPLPSPS